MSEDLPTRIRAWLVGYDAELNRFLTLPVERTGGASIAAHLPCDAAALLREALAELEREPSPGREGDCWTCERHYPDSEGWHCCHLLLSDPLRAAVVAWLDGWACPDDVPPRNGPHPDCPGWRKR